MKIIFLLLILLSTTHNLQSNSNTSTKGYWRRINATEEQKVASQNIINENINKKKVAKKKKQDFLKELSLAQEADKKQFLRRKEETKYNSIKNADEPFTFIAHFNSCYYYGANLELLNASNQSDYYSFMRYLFDTGIYIHPHTQNSENETIEFKAIMRMKGIAGDAGRYLNTELQKTKIGWSITENESSSSINRFSLWMRELWLKYYFDENKKGFFVTGFFPYSIGHGITLGNGDINLIGQPLPGCYTFDQIDQFKPGILISNTFNNDQSYWDLYLGFGTNYNTSFERTAELSEGHNTTLSQNISRGTNKHNYIFAAQVKSFMTLKNINTDCVLNPYLVINYDNTQKVEFKSDAENRLYTIGGCFEWKNGPLSINIEGAQNLGHQNVKAWDRNEFNFSTVSWNSHLLFIDPNISSNTPYPISAAAATNENQFTHAVGVPISPSGTPDSEYSRKFINGEIFEITPAAGSTPSPLIYKNSNSRFRNAYKNSYRGWFLMGDIGYQFKQWNIGTSMGIVSGDDAPNDSQDYILATRRFQNDSSGNSFVYKDTNKTYKGFVGLDEMFASKSITPCFIHEVQKLNNSLVDNNRITSPQITNLLFLGIGLKHHSLRNNKELLADINIISYAQKKPLTKGTNMTYTEYTDLEYSENRQIDSKKILDSSLGFEFNASLQCKLTQDLDVSGKMALFIPGKHYTSAEGKYLPFNKQQNLLSANNTGILTVEEHFNTTLGNDTAFFVTTSVSYNFDSLLFKNKQKAFKKNYLKSDIQSEIK